MPIFRIALATLAAVSTCTATALAQNTISVATTHSHAGEPPSQACKEQVAVLTDLLSIFPTPVQWKWVVICDDAAWRRFLWLRGVETDSAGVSASPDGASEEIYASTEIEAHVTCVRGTTLLHPDSKLAGADHVIAHELAHIVLHTRDEGRAERQALLWMREREQASPAVAAKQETGPNPGI
ncbi:MAG TPA: hypothetical protein VGD59_10875 [Acidisarcina sp.]